MSIEILQNVVKDLQFKHSNLPTNLETITIKKDLLKEISVIEDDIIYLKAKRKAKNKLIRPSEYDLKRLEKEIARRMNTTVAQMHTKTRKREAVVARQIFMTYLNKFSSFKDAGFWYRRDHATCIHAKKTINNALTSPDVNDPINKKVRAINFELDLEL